MKALAQQPISTGSRARSARGFSLIVTLMMMILLSTIALGLLGLSSISLRASSRGEAQQTARANARLALMLAIGELQKQTGPDTRVTARADVLQENSPPVLGAWRSWEGEDHEQGGAAAGRPVSPGNYKTKKASRFLSWLVSGAPNALADSSTPPTTTAAEGTVPLIGTNTVGDGQARQQIHLAPVKIDNKSIPGSYAWWVGGENEKARLPQPYTPKLDGEWAGNLQSHSTADPEEFGMSSLLADAQPAAKASSLKQTDFIAQASSDKASRTHFHDLSTVSTGLLTNTATGGWRKDMSLFTENYDNLPTSDLKLFRITPDKDDSVSRATATDVRPAGSLLYPWAGYRGSASDRAWDQQGAVASWANLRNYAMTYQQLGGSGPFSLKATALKEVGLPATYLHKVRLRPVVARVQWVFSYWGRIASDGKQFTPGILMTPVFTLWNPYNVSLTNIGPLYFTVGDEANPSPFPVAFKYEVTTGNPDHKISGYRSLLTGSKNYTDVAPFAVSSIKTLRYELTTVPDLQPGATLVVSPSNQNLPSHRLPMAPGYRTDMGHLFILTKASDPTSWIYTLDGTAKMKLEPKFNNTFSYKGKDVVGYRLVVRDDELTEDKAYRKAGTDGYEMEYQMLISPAAAQTYPNLQNLADSKPLSAIRNTADPFFSLVTGLRVANNLFGPDQSYAPSKGFTQANPLANYSTMGDMDVANPAVQKNYPGTGAQVNAAIDYSFLKHAAFDDTVPNVADTKGYILTAMTARGMTRGIAADLPVKPLASLAELQNWDMRFGNPVPPFAYNVIGNSDASPLFPPNAVVNGSSTAATNLQHDDSYCANHLLFDDWFFSSIAGGTAGGYGGSTALMKSNFVNFLKGTTPLVNRAYKPIVIDAVRASQSGSGANGVFQEQVDTPNSWRTIASRLEVEGMFNVNSTSVAAWRALLGHARNQKVPYYSETGAITLSGNTDHAVSRASVAGNVEAGTGGAASEFTGYRKLDDKLLDELAQKIVEQVRKRGPFLSLSEFVNRQLSTDKDLAIAGAIQAALNQLEKDSSFYSGLVDNYESQNKYATDVPGADYQFPEAAAGLGAYGLPGWTRQADVLRPLAPILSARDDTFTIRAYGDARDSEGKVIATATCEAVVRRTRDYCDPADQADSAEVLRSTVNKTFGRHFDVVSFRWLGRNEI
ncbi:hypothetical protein [Luteolibacter sp. LG18]|uniref:type IV pilus modification PilV family protein n=1 Tax=Luteolibacter sp. LG18 TaxID=2819286 RepID=UPI002B2B8FFF|nr:hypothetical protein llg_25660 [Luteolibacter sp. LG18]